MVTQDWSYKRGSYGVLVQPDKFQYITQVSFKQTRQMYAIRYICRVFPPLIPGDSAHALELHLPLIHQPVCPLKDLVERLIVSGFVDRHAQRGDDLVEAEIFLDLGIDGTEDLIPRLIIPPLEQHHKLITADTEDGAMGIIIAEQPTGGLYVFIAGLVAQGIIDTLQAVHVADDDAEFPGRAPVNLCLKEFLLLGIGMLLTPVRESLKAAVRAWSRSSVAFRSHLRMAK